MPPGDDNNLLIQPRVENGIRHFGAARITGAKNYSLLETTLILLPFPAPGMSQK